MQQIIELTLEQVDAYSSIKPVLDGNIFHVTPLRNLDPILQAQEIRPNSSGNLEGAFGSYINSYARIRNRVSLFDFHNPPESKIEQHVRKCLPTRGASSDQPLAFLFLSENFWPQVIPYSREEFEANLGHQVVPYVEATYPGPIPLHAINKIFRITFAEDPNSLASLLKRAHKNAL
ncbi:hypothetical protein [Marinobacterium rhizophilum]|uniref:hypothetical protein n=1 Tax=Marinobacterium rhizophilum TaxID=420402 RepID=UPI0012ECA1BA|nr:hypothetical protein [Marinobacterium rhizophilum]